MDHIWTIENWEQNIDLMEEGHRTGFRLRFDSGIDPEVRRACKEFAAFLRKEYFFPLRVVAYIKNKKKIRAMDGDLVYGTFWSMEDDYTVELTPIGMERQATKYARYVLDDYAETREHP